MDITSQKGITSITLKLNSEEAKLVRGIFRSITGGMRGPRKLVDEIETALGNLGIGAYEAPGQIDLPSQWSQLREEIGDRS